MKIIYYYYNILYRYRLYEYNITDYHNIIFKFRKFKFNIHFSYKYEIGAYYTMCTQYTRTLHKNNKYYRMRHNNICMETILVNVHDVTIIINMCVI